MGYITETSIGLSYYTTSINWRILVYLQYSQDAKPPTAFDLYTPTVKSLTVKSEYSREHFKEMNRITQVVQQRIEKAQRLQKKHVKKSMIEVGDQVMLKVESIVKLHTTFCGPY